MPKNDGDLLIREGEKDDGEELVGGSDHGGEIAGESSPQSADDLLAELNPDGGLQRAEEYRKMLDGKEIVGGSDHGGEIAGESSPQSAGSVDDLLAQLDPDGGLQVAEEYRKLLDFNTRALALKEDYGLEFCLDFFIDLARPKTTGQIQEGRHIKERFRGLFEILLSRENIDHGYLSLPTSELPIFFPSPQPTGVYMDEYLRVIDARGRIWSMPMKNNVTHLLLKQGWKEFSDNHGLQPGDVIQFCRPTEPEFGFEYLILCVYTDRFPAPYFPRLELKQQDVEQDWIVFPVEEEHNFSNPKLMKLSDSQNRDWTVELAGGSDMTTGLFRNGWKPFVDDNNLEAGDTVLFSGPFHDGGNNQLLVAFEKRLKSVEDPSSSSTPASQSSAIEIPLFTLVLMPNCIKGSSLVIPVEAIDFLPPMSVAKGISNEFIYLTDRGNRRWKMELHYSRDECAFVITNGWEDFRELHKLDAFSSIRFSLPTPGRLTFRHYLVEIDRDVSTYMNAKKMARDLLEGADLGVPVLYSSSWKSRSVKRGKLLFKICLTSSDYTEKKLSIPRAKALGAINFLPPLKDEAEIEVSDSTMNWYMTLTHNRDGKEGCLEIKGGWGEFAEHHKLEDGDEISFWRPKRRFHDNHYAIGIEKAKLLNIILENLLFEMELTALDVRSSSLKLPWEANSHFMSGISKKLLFTDGEGKQWAMEFTVDAVQETFMITKGWEEYVRRYRLDEKDVIKVYKPAQAQKINPSHFLICYVKSETLPTNENRTRDFKEEATPKCTCLPFKPWGKSKERDH